jgi:amidohydrolase
MSIINVKRVIEFRKELHQNPERSGEEYKTAQIVHNYLNSLVPDQLIGQIGGTGIAAVFEGKLPGKTILIRCELDALPIYETNSFAHRSKKEGISHKCGHDGHMAIVCGVARGKVILLFQPAEETGEGAAAVLADQRFISLKPDLVFALDNLPGYPPHMIIVKEGSFTVAVHSIIIHLKGKTAHAGQPHKGINPAMAMARIIQEFDRFNNDDIRHPDFCLVTPIYMRMGEEAYGISAGEGEVHFTVRCIQNNRLIETERRLEDVVRQISSKFNLEVEISWTEKFSANENNDTAVEWIKKAAGDQELSVLELDVPLSWGEDFGLFTEQYQGAMFGLGAGEDIPELHHPDYDFPDVILPTGIQIFQAIIQRMNHV